MNELLYSFLLLALAHGLAVVLPGPDFVVVLGESLQKGRAAGRSTALGIGVGILTHCGLFLLGVSLLLEPFPRVYDLLRTVAALYLAALAIKTFWPRSQARLEPRPPEPPSKELARPVPRLAQDSFQRGFWTNLLNPKVALFFLALFTVIIDLKESSPWWQGLVSLYLAGATTAWFALVAQLATLDRFERFLTQRRSLLEKITGGVLLLVAMQLCFQR
ncbi:MAG: LysE family translocator [Verrucomicrobiota bacterium]